MRYFWYYTPETTPSPIVEPAQVSDSGRLCVACTQTGLSIARQKSLVEQWCRVLPTLDHVRLLWLTTKVPQVLFDAVCRMPMLEGLYVKWSGVRSIENVTALTNLKYLHLGSSTQVESIECLRRCTRLEWLGLENLARIDDLSPLSSLSGLVGLDVSGSMWKTWKVATLAPIGALTGLRYLGFTNLRTVDRTLRPLFTLRHLETLDTALWWDADELAELRRLNPGLTS